MPSEGCVACRPMVLFIRLGVVFLGSRMVLTDVLHSTESTCATYSFSSLSGEQSGTRSGVPGGKRGAQCEIVKAEGRGVAAGRVLLQASSTCSGPRRTLHA